MFLRYSANWCVTSNVKVIATITVVDGCAKDFTLKINTADRTSVNIAKLVSYYKIILRRFCMYHVFVSSVVLGHAA